MHYAFFLYIINGHLAMSKVLQRHVVHAKRTLTFGPAQNVRRDIWSMSTHLPYPMHHHQLGYQGKEELLLVIQPQQLLDQQNRIVFFYMCKPKV